MQAKVRHFVEQLRSFYRSRRTTILMIVAAAIAVVFTSLTAVWLSRSYGINVPTAGTIYVTGVAAYGGDISTVNGLNSIDWGNIRLGDSKNVSFYLRSTSSIETRLAFNVTDWNPQSIRNYLTLSWNYNGTQLEPKQEVLVTFTLSTSATTDFADYIVTNSVKSYNFTIHIYTVK